MSTFKIQPVYAELLLGWLDLTRYGDIGLKFIEVLRRMDWTFKGGVLGDYPGTALNETSESRFPSGNTIDMAVDLTRGPTPETRALKRILMLRKSERFLSLKARAPWYTSFMLMRSLSADCENPCRSGLSAVYAVAARMWRGLSTRTGSSTRDWENAATYIREVMYASAAGSHLDLSATADVMDRMLVKAEEVGLPAMMAWMESVRLLVRRCTTGDIRAKTIRVGTQIMEGELQDVTEIDEIFSTCKIGVGGLVLRYVHGVAFWRTDARCYILSMSDLFRLQQIVISIVSGLFATMSQVCMGTDLERTIDAAAPAMYCANVRRILETGAVMPVGEEVNVCKIFKKAFSVHLCALSGPLCTEEHAAMMTELAESSHSNLADWTGWIDSMSNLTAVAQFNVGKVYKICPAPDCAPGATLIDRHKQVVNPNPSKPEAIAMLKEELTEQILRAYIRSRPPTLALKGAPPRWLRSYKARKYDEVPSGEIDRFLAWEGTATMPTRDRMDPSVWKDSGAGWDSMEEAFDPMRNPRKANMLTRMIFDDTCPMPEDMAPRTSHDHKADLKPEGYKDPARIIYSGNLTDRHQQSVQEVAVHEVMVHHPSYMIGARAELRNTRERILTAKAMGYISGARHITVFYSYDIKGWSPNMGGPAQRASHEVWAKLYGSEVFARSARVNELGRVYMNKRGYRGWFINPESNFEGYNGKEMTVIQIAMLSMSVKVWRRSAVTKGLLNTREAARISAILLAYIDDGLAKLLLPEDRVKPLFDLFKETTVRVFKDCGFVIEVAKCFPSDRFAIFLNEPYYGGRHVVHGTRAAMTICAESVEAHTTLMERVGAVSAGVRGAVMAGLSATAGSMLMAFHIYMHLKEWTALRDPMALAIWTMGPRNWDCLGCPSTMQLGTTGGGASWEESTWTMREWASYNVSVRKFYITCARIPIMKRSSSSIVRSPLGGMIEGGYMIETRIPSLVRRKMEELNSAGLLSTLASLFLSYATMDDFNSYSDAMIPLPSTNTLQEQVLADIGNAHPSAVFEAFTRRIERSATVQTLIGPKALRSVIKENRADVVRSISALCARIAGRN